MIRLPRQLLVMLAAGFALFNVALGLSSLQHSTDWVRVVAALALYCGAVVVSVMVGRTVSMPAWLAVLDVGVALVISVAVASTLDPHDPKLGYATWYVGAVGSLLTIVAVRRHAGIAWLGLALLALQTVVWAGDPVGLLTLGVPGDLIWIAIADMFTRAMERAAGEVRSYAAAERETVEWQAAQDAHHYERQVRLGQTARTALPMLTRIVRDRGELDAAARQECRVLEQSIRDEIRGRRLLNDAVREQVLAHRRRGAMVQVLDDGGVDDVPPELLDPVLERVAAELEGLTSDRIVLRTAPKGSAKAVTVVAISSNSEASALGLDDEDEQVDLWLELDRPTAAAVAAVA
jgi:hypothetical protein